MWILISNSLDIDFIHGDIHGRACKKPSFNIGLKYKMVSQEGVVTFIAARNTVEPL